MRVRMTRHVLERVFGFADPAPTGSGDVTYECSYCGACAEEGPLPHAADCPYWAARLTFDSPAAARLAEQALGSG